MVAEVALNGMEVYAKMILQILLPRLGAPLLIFSLAAGC